MILKTVCKPDNLLKYLTCLTTLFEVFVIWIAIWVPTAALVFLMTVELFVTLFTWIETSTTVSCAVLIIHTVLTVHWIRANIILNIRLLRCSGNRL